MNIESSSIKNTNTTNSTNTNVNNNKNSNSSVKFADELKELEKSEKTEEKDTQTAIQPNEETQQNEELQTKESVPEEEIVAENTVKQEEEKLVGINIPPETNLETEENESFIATTDEKELEPKNHLDKSLEALGEIVKKLNQSDEKPLVSLKEPPKPDDNKEKGDDLINNDFSIKDNKDILPQMNPNMNFSGDGQPFSSFMGNEEQKKPQPELKVTAQDLAEEKAILSTMEENIEIANKNTSVQPTQQKTIAESLANIEQRTELVEKTVNRNDGIKKIDIQSGITIETVVKYDSVVMNEADVEVFSALVEQGEANINNLAPEAAQKSVHVSKTLADMLAKAKETQQPLRIDFDNGISIIIKISRDGKLSADFLPSTQVAEAYLKENLPLLKQRFDEKNLDYEALNQRERREQHNQENRKKGRRDE